MTMVRGLLLLLGGLLLISGALWITGYFDEPHDDWYRDLRRGHWIWWGAEASVLDETLRIISEADGDRRDSRFDTIETYGPGNWTYEFAQLGAARRLQAQAAEQSEDPGSAGRLYHEASVYYGLAKYPGYGVDPNEISAHQMQLETYEAAQSLNPGVRFSVEVIPLQEGKIRGYLHLPPAGEGRLPLVIGTNGIDVFKAEFGPVVEALTERRIGFFAFDMPSTGEASSIPLRPENDEIYLQVMRHFQQRDDIDEDRIALWGVSFGGNPVVSVAQQSPPGLRAVVNWCGPVHDIFQIPAYQLDLVADMYLDALRYRLHLPGADSNQIVEAMRGFSLVDRGLMAPGTVTTKVPILTVNARGDYVAPESDMELVTRSTSSGELMYSGSDDHCPQDRYAATEKTVEWLERHL